MSWRGIVLLRVDEFAKAFAVAVGCFALLFLLTNSYTPPIFISGEQARSPEEELERLKTIGGPAWPGTTYQAAHRNGEVILTRYWLGLLESRIAVIPRPLDWEYSSEVELGPAQGTQTLVLGGFSTIVGVVAGGLFARSRRSMSRGS